MTLHKHIEEICSIAAPTLKIEAPPLFTTMVDALSATSAGRLDIDIAVSAMSIEEKWLCNAINREALKEQREEAAKALAEAQT